MGMPALLKEGMSWREIRTRAMHATPVKLAERPEGGHAAANDPPEPESGCGRAASLLIQPTAPAVGDSAAPGEVERGGISVSS